MIALLRQSIAALRPTARERAALALLAALCAALVAVAAFDWSQRAYLAALDSAEIAAQSAEMHVNGGLRQALAAETAKATAWSVTAPTRPIAMLRAQTQLNSAAHAAGISDARVSLVEPSADQARASRVQLRIEGAFAWDSFIDLLRRISDLRASFVPVAIDVRTDAAPRFQLTVETLILIESETP